MMFPSAVQGHMPFVEQYKQEQIKKVIDKHRSRHRSGPDSKSGDGKSIKNKNTHSMPILWQSVYNGQRPRFISMPTLDDDRVSQLQHQQRDTKSSKSFLSSLKKLFTGKSEDTVDSTPASSKKSQKKTEPVVQANYNRSYSSQPKSMSVSKKPADGEITIGSSRSPKRQRMRTISNISGIMETIEEVSEIILSTDTLSDDDNSLSSGLPHVCSAPDTTVFFSCGNLSSHTDSSSSRHGSNELICAV